MAYMGFCESCFHLYADVTRNAVVSYLLRHSIKCHSGIDERIITFRISAKDYRDYLRNKGNPKFWEAWRNSKKLTFSLIG